MGDIYSDKAKTQEENDLVELNLPLALAHWKLLNSFKWNTSKNQKGLENIMTDKQREEANRIYKAFANGECYYDGSILY